MIKRDELKRGCIAHAADDEPVFVLRAQDELAPLVIRIWAELAKERGVNAEKVRQAKYDARVMEQWPRRRLPD